MKKVKKISFLSKLIKSIKDFDYYKDISNQKVSDIFKYFFKIIIIYSIIVTIGIMYSTNKSFNEIKNFVKTEIVEFTYSKGNLKINNNEHKSFYNNAVIIDTSKELQESHKENANIFIGKTHVNIKIEDYVINLKYNDFIKQDLNKEDLIGLFEKQNVKQYVLVTIIALIWIIIILVISTLLDVLVIALIGLIISKVVGNNNIKFTNIFNIAIHTLTLPILLAMIYYLINVFTGFYVKYFSIMYTSIATIYMITSILLITSEKNNNKQNI